jgi:hypothetical protein
MLALTPRTFIIICSRGRRSPRVGDLAYGHPLESGLNLNPGSTYMTGSSSAPRHRASVAHPQGKYDEEIEVYRHHLEQMYKLCRPCQAAVEYYIKHQNRQLRALLLSHQFRRREADQAHVQV